MDSISVDGVPSISRPATTSSQAEASPSPPSSALFSDAALTAVIGSDVGEKSSKASRSESNRETFSPLVDDKELSSTFDDNCAVKLVIANNAGQLIKGDRAKSACLVPTRTFSEHLSRREAIFSAKESPPAPLVSPVPNETSVDDE